MSYSPPAWTDPVVLSGGYTVPNQNTPVILGLEIGGDLSGALLIALPPPSLPLALIARERHIEIALAIALPVTLPELTLAAAATLDLALISDVGPRLAMRLQSALKTATGAGMRQQQMMPASAGFAALATTADPICVSAALLQQAMLPRPCRLAEAHQHGLPLRQGGRIPQQESLRARLGLAEAHQHGLSLRQGATLLQADTLKPRNRLTLFAQTAAPIARALQVFEQPAQPTATRLTLRWQHADEPQPGRWWPRYEPPSHLGVVLCQRPYTPRPLHCPVVLHWEPIQQPHCPGVDPDPDQPGVIVPIQEVYIVINTFSLVRADNGQAVDALDFDATLTADSWTWSWSANIPASQMSRVRSLALGQFVELIATLNGTAIRVVVESLSRSRKFGSAALSIGGRGRAAWLADPHSPMVTVMNAQPRTAQQLLNDALMVNGVSIGWAVTWNVEDWSVPAGLWSHTGAYIDAATKIAESAGGYVQAHDTAQTLIIKPYYPLAPWAWAAATPDIVLPDAVCTTEGIDWKDSPAYNAVWVVGGSGGRRDKIKRAGTAADQHAPTVVDPLATDTVMTRQRGLRVLADTGRQAHIAVNLPVLAETGIIKPGKLIRYTEQGETHLGLSRAVTVRYQFPTASQTVTMETHELESV